MRVLRIFNNSVALVRDEKGREIVVQGRGIAFQARPGDALDPALVERRFVPEPSDRPEEFARMVAGIPREHIAVAEEILSQGERFRLSLERRVLIALADHISLAITRCRSGAAFDNPWEWEVRLLYEREVMLGVAALGLIERRTGVRLPEVEAIALALHFVNAQAAGGEIGEAVRSARLIREILALIETEYGVASTSADTLARARFAAHLRYLFLGHLSGRRTVPLIAEIARGFRDDDPRAYACAGRIARYLVQEMGWNISDDETIYLALHIQRMTCGNGGAPAAS